MDLYWDAATGTIGHGAGDVWGVVRTPSSDDAAFALASVGASPRAVLIPTFAGLEGPGWWPGVRERWSKFAQGLVEVAAFAESPVRLSILPRATDIISDIPGTLTFLRTFPAFGLVVDPAALLVESMLPDRMDHLSRIVDALVKHPACEAVVARDGADEWDRALLGAAEGAGRVVVRRRATDGARGPGGLGD